MKRPAAPIGVSVAKRQRLCSGFWEYVAQVSKKHSRHHQGRLDPIIASHGFPPTNLQEETNVKFAQRVLAPVAAGDRTWQLLLIMLFQAPDHCWSFHAVLAPLIKGVLAQRACKSAKARKHFDKVQLVLQRRADKTGIFGNGEMGIYNAEHLTATVKGKTHVEGLRFKLERWPRWIEGALQPLLMSWPASDDVAMIGALLQENRFARKFPEGIRTKIRVNRERWVPIEELFDGDARKTYSVVSQALLFSEMLKPTDEEQRKLRIKNGWGIGPFVLRGLWMDVQRDKALLRSFPQLDTATFCPGFTGALGGAEACNLTESTGIQLNPGLRSAPNWSAWDVQVRFNAWMHALRVSQPKGSGPRLHSSELEGCLCFFLRYKTMKAHCKGSREYEAASRAIGCNFAAPTMKKIFARRPMAKAKRLLAPHLGKVHRGMRHCSVVQ